MIRAVDADCTLFEEYSNPDLYGLQMGEGVLTPTECVITETAGGDYALTLTHPIDAAGRWALLKPFSLICAPIPKTETPPITADASGVIGIGSQVWTTNAQTSLYSNTTTAYAAYVSGQGYYPGDKCSYNGYNWQCLQITLIEPSTSASAWKRLGAIRQVLKTLASGTTLVCGSSYTSSYSGTYLAATLLTGGSGYVYTSAADWSYTIDESSSILDDVGERVLTHQLFRVTDITIDGKAMTVKVSAKHVSYDWSASLVGSVSFTEVTVASAIGAIQSACLPDGATSAPGIYAEKSAETLTAACTRKTVTSVLLDPESGIVNQARMRLVRDGREFFFLGSEQADAYSASTAYAVGDLVSYDGYNWRCVTAGTGNTPSVSSAAWELMGTYPEDHGVSIRYGVNLQGVTWRRDYSKIVTRIMPVAKDSSGNDYTLPAVYVDSDNRNAYPYDFYEALSVDKKIGTDGTEAEVQAMMTEAAEAEFEKGIDLPTTTLTVNFLLLGDTEEFSQYKGLQSLALYDWVEIEHPDIGLSTRSQVKSYKWDAIREAYTEITLGDAFEKPTHTVYGYNVATQSIGADKLTPEAIKTIQNA